jgi:membrane-bound ClpP family serine protease
VTGSVQLFSDSELDEQTDSENWQRGDQLRLRRGLSAAQAEELNLVDDIVSDYDEFLRKHGLDNELTAVQPRWVVTELEQLAASPWFARTVLFIAFFALISEASAPGVGVPGFVSLLCFLLFFWSQFLSGTAEWLEVMLFAGGVACLFIEFFAVPGFGVFGIGGTLMVLGSVLLASQTFVIPRNTYQYEQLADSIYTVVSACAGTLTALVAMRHLLPQSPLFRRLMLTPPDEVEAEEIDHRESLVDWSHLVGKQGVTTTRLAPSGKARFGDDIVDVVGDGELIPKGTHVYIAEVLGNRVVVRTVE